MQIKGWRKLASTAVLGVAIGLKSDWSQAQVDLMTTLIYAAFIGNGVEHVVEGIKDGIRTRNLGGSRIVSSKSVSAKPEKATIDTGTH